MQAYVVALITSVAASMAWAASVLESDKWTRAARRRLFVELEPGPTGTVMTCVTGISFVF